MKKLNIIIFLLTAAIIFSACASRKKKSEVKGFKKFYHNTTAKFNGYFNAEELMKESMLTLQGMNVDNYNKILTVYDYMNIDNPQAVKADMDKAIEKLSTVATIHDVSNYVDDCYLNIGKAQFLKQDYIAAEETFVFFEEVFDPRNPYGRAYDSKAYQKKKGRKTKKDIREEKKEKKEEKKEKQDERKEKEKKQEEERKDKDKERKEKLKQRKAEKKAKEKERKNRKKNKSSSSSKKKEEPKKTEVPKVEPVPLTPEQEARLAEQEAKAAVLEEEAKRRKEIEEEKKKKKAKEEEKYKNQGEGGVFRNKSAYVEGLYWLARTYIETRRYTAAEYAFERLIETPGLSKDIESRIPVARAHLFLQTKEYEKAALELESAIELEGNRNKRARYAFILAQLNELKNDDAGAYEAYRKARKFSTKYELEFNANLNELKLSYRKGQISQKKALNKLDGYLEDGKNREFQDQIYFTQAQIKLDGGDLAGAKADFESSIGSGGGNKNVKLEAYYKLAEVLFNEGLYSESKANYDNAIKLMNKGDERYKDTERIAKSLNEIALNIKTVKLQDSLIILSKLPEDELKELAEKIIKERKALAAESGEPEKPNQRKSNIFATNRSNGGRSKFFAYNPISINQGKVEFKRTWGDRTLEDNWRRSLRSNANQEVEDLEFGNDDEVAEDEVTDEEIRELLRDIPKTDAQLATANIRIENALFQLGVLFRERVEDYQKSIQVLERLVKDYPQYKKRDEALFYLYLSYLDVENGPEANRVKALLVSEYPDSKFAKLANDPNYAQTLIANEDSIEKYYESTFALFEEGKYNEVIDRVAQKDKLYKKQKTYSAKFAMLNAMSLGNVKGKTDYIEALQRLTRSYPKTPEEVKANEILKFLKGDQDAFNEIIYEEAVQAFEDQPDKLHYVFVVTYDLSQSEFDRAKIDILNYNKKFHRFDNLQISNISLSQENNSRIILIRSFDDKEKSMKYFDGVEKNKELFIKSENVGYDIFPTTQKNYREVIKQKTVTNYRLFFSEEYQKDN